MVSYEDPEGAMLSNYVKEESKVPKEVLNISALDKRVNKELPITCLTGMQNRACVISFFHAIKSFTDIILCGL